MSNAFRYPRSITHRQAREELLAVVAFISSAQGAPLPVTLNLARNDYFEIDGPIPCIAEIITRLGWPVIAVS